MKVYCYYKVVFYSCHDRLLLWEKNRRFGRSKHLCSTFTHVSREGWASDRIATADLRECATIFWGAMFWWMKLSLTLSAQFPDMLKVRQFVWDYFLIIYSVLQFCVLQLVSQNADMVMLASRLISPVLTLKLWSATFFYFPSFCECRSYPLRSHCLHCFQGWNVYCNDLQSSTIRVVLRNTIVYFSLVSWLHVCSCM